MFFQVLLYWSFALLKVTQPQVASEKSFLSFYKPLIQGYIFHILHLICLLYSVICTYNIYIPSCVSSLGVKEHYIPSAWNIPMKKKQKMDVQDVNSLEKCIIQVR